VRLQNFLEMAQFFQTVFLANKYVRISFTKTKYESIYRNGVKDQLNFLEYDFILLEIHSKEFGMKVNESNKGQIKRFFFNFAMFRHF